MPSLYLLRHADAVMGVPDEGRPLSQKGEMQLAAWVEGLKSVSWFTPEVVWHSGLKRAEQTAMGIMQGLGLSIPIEIMPQLAPNGGYKMVAKRCKVLSKDTLLVSHNPFLEELVKILLQSESLNSVCHFRKAALMEFKIIENEFSLSRFLTWDTFKASHM